jgi:iron complex transport system permease protein
MLAHALTLFFPDLAALEYLSLILFLVPAFILYAWKLRSQTKISVFGNRMDTDIPRLILAGLCFNLLVGALFSLAQFLFMVLNLKFPSQLWFGNFRFIEWPMLGALVTGVVFIYFAVIRLSAGLEALSFGSDFAAGLGLNVRRTQTHAIFISLVAVGLVTCFFGVFSFMGLLLPLLLRSLPGLRHSFRRELLWGPFISGGFFVIMDSCCRYVTFYGAEVPTGMVASLLGTLILVVIVLRNPSKLVK